MSERKSYDVAVIGAGSGGLSAAFTALGFGKKVVVIDKNKPGGECTWSGCVPSKALINAAKEAKVLKKYGKELPDTKEAMKRVHQVIQNVYKEESPDVLEKDGIDFIQGPAIIQPDKTIGVGNQIIEASKIIISTGSHPFVPPIDGVDTVDYLTNESFFRLESLPKSMIVLGGGAIGTELSQALNRLGVKVSLVELQERIVPLEEEKFGKALQQHLEKEGVNIYTGHKAFKIEESESGVKVHVEADGNKKVIEGERLLVALGRRPNIQGIGLEEAGINFTPRGIEVNDHLETSVKGIYAIGDVTGGYQFSHMANAEAIQAVQNAVLPFNRKISYDHVAWCTFTEPEIARAGMTEKEAREKYGDSIRVYERSYTQLDRAKTNFEDIGEVKVIVNRKGKVLGTSVLGERAGELISEVQVVKTLGINMGKLAGVIHPYPTYSEILAKIGKQVAVDNLLNMPIIKLFRK